MVGPPGRDQASLMRAAREHGFDLAVRVPAALHKRGLVDEVVKVEDQQVGAQQAHAAGSAENGTSQRHGTQLNMGFPSLSLAPWGPSVCNTSVL